MFKLNLILIVLLVICALGVVTAQHEARKLNMAWENERKIARKMQIEWGKLQLEQSTLIARRQIEYAAKEQLNMEVPSVNSIQIISAKKVDELRWVVLDNVKSY
ncbi:cell division protein FtsL [Nitrosomonas sp.]|uniref:cell division protein FtsL n=1 Tax=Nitrosomonas sp. TaxID=42353 RepID=UPI001E0A9671|nr:cell division protein FtsL [Nitrosomonas sp.]MCB1947569.1 cell division protein FtsL [Nitrosomonas sp.]MCP5243378.1 cell division protein FtsL [Burkholderiales bacterium]MDR4514820.1 cell division protein FtsL [Nitrosomonas sp.]